MEDCIGTLVPPTWAMLDAKGISETFLKSEEVWIVYLTKVHYQIFLLAVGQLLLLPLGNP